MALTVDFFFNYSKVTLHFFLPEKTKWTEIQPTVVCFWGKVLALWGQLAWIVNSESEFEAFLIRVRMYIHRHTHAHRSPRIFSILRQLCIQVLRHCWCAQWYTGSENKWWSLLRPCCLPQNSQEWLQLVTEHPSQFPWTLKEVWELWKDCGFPIDHHLLLKRWRERMRTLRKLILSGQNREKKFHILLSLPIGRGKEWFFMCCQISVGFSGEMCSHLWVT